MFILYPHLSMKIYNQRHILSIYVRNKPGVMNQVSSLFTRRAFNIDSIAVGTTENEDVSTMTIILKGDAHDLDQFKKQLLKLADVLDLKEIPYYASVLRELLLVRIHAKKEKRAELFGIIEVFTGNILEITDDTMLLEANGIKGKLAVLFLCSSLLE